MTNEQKARIITFRHDGTGYATIAAMLGISKETVKSFCRRNALTGNTAAVPSAEGLCRNCGAEIVQNPKARKKCSALPPAISPTALSEVLPMNENSIKLYSRDEFQREKKYLTARSVAETMYKAGIISDRELAEIDTILLEIFRPSLSALLCGKPLNNLE